MAWDWLKKRFARASESRPEGMPRSGSNTIPGFGPILWIDAADNPWGVPVLDVRPITAGVSMTTDKRHSVNALSFRMEDGESFASQIPEVSRRIPTELRYQVEQAALEPGDFFIPQKMEDKWALYFVNGRILCIRSWTREVLAVAHTRIAGGFLEVETLQGTLVPQQEPALSVRALDFLLRRLVLRLEYPAPIPQNLGREPAQAAVFCMSAYGRAAQFATAHTLHFEPPEKPLRTYSALHLAVRQGDAARVRELVNQKIAWDILDRNGLPPLHWAVARPDSGMLELLLECGSPVDLRSEEGVTALMQAVERRNADFVKFLLDKGADPNARDQRGFTAMHRAAEMGERDIVRLLLERGATPKVEAQGQTPRSLAASRQHTEIVKLLDEG